MPGEASVDSQAVIRPTVGIREIVTIWILFFINLFNYIDRYIVSG